MRWPWSVARNEATLHGGEQVGPVAALAVTLDPCGFLGLHGLLVGLGEEPAEACSADGPTLHRDVNNLGLHGNPPGFLTPCRGTDSVSVEPSVHPSGRVATHFTKEISTNVSVPYCGTVPPCGTNACSPQRWAGCARVGTSRHARACLSLPMVSLAQAVPGAPARSEPDRGEGGGFSSCPPAREGEGRRCGRRWSTSHGPLLPAP